ncbi:uncharacterized protein LOC131647852 isoform X1 [Vicia villosa]|uniref:uncharacterized protein LOC131647852 isoform X1 n=1 Tax=Vicia villosa TaxID=3911 RepID=UPI00273CECCE|nr:uncharacterized protein LOC131647852 isoform X1 [Vicia villosa]
MLQLLYAVIFAEMLMIMSFLFKTPLRKLVIMALNTAKRGRGPVVVKTVTATLVVMLGSALYSIYEIRCRYVESVTIIDPTEQVLLSNHLLQASLLGFVLFLSLVIDRLHHYIRELRVLRKTMETVKNQNRSFERNKSVNASENKALKEEIGVLKSKIEKLESECEVRRKQG